MRKPFLSFLRDARGASAVEFALIVGPFILLLFGSVEFGRLLWARQAVQDTAIAAARCVGVLQSPCTHENVFSQTRTEDFILVTAAGRGIYLTSDALKIDREAICSGLGGFSKVEITHTFHSPLPEFTRLIGAAASVSIAACFPNQDHPAS